MSETLVNVTIRLSAETVAAVDKLASEQERNRSQMLRVLIQRGIKAEGSGA